jgi:O-antigen/teichoic acid export membrane protein
VAAQGDGGGVDGGGAADGALCGGAPGRAVSRTRRAGIAASFGYLQFGLALASGILVVPFVLSRVGNEAYGVWLGFGELVAYSAMADLGVLGVLPWLVAEADGRGDRAHMRRLVSAGLAAASLAAVVFAALALGLLAVAPGLTGVSPAQRGMVIGPLMLLVAGMAASYPLRVYHAVLAGLQDVAFAGKLGVAQAAMNVALIVGLLAAGQGLYALAAAATVPTLVVATASWLRVRRIAPELVRGWRLPSRALLRTVTVQGIGGWVGGLGWRMISATSNLVILAISGPVAAVAYAMTVRLADVLMQMSWQVPDAGLVGLAQLKGEGRAERAGEIAVSILRLTLIGAGAVACSILAFNPSFVSLWVGADRFAGLGTNALIAAGVVALSLGHSLFSTAATLGARVQIGFATILQGLVHLGTAIVLGRRFGLAGVAAAAVIGTLLVAYPAGAYYLRKVSGLTQGDLWRRALGPWSARAAVLMLIGAAVGIAGWRASVWPPLFAAPVLAAAYVWLLRPLYADLPLPGRVRLVLARLRLVPEHGGAGVPLP